MASMDYRNRPGLKRVSKLRYWLMPGMRVKRHIAHMGLGLLVLGVGILVGSFWLIDTRQVAALINQGGAGGALWQRWGNWLSFILMFAGAGTLIAAVRGLNRSLLSNWTPKHKETAVLLHRRVSLARGPRIVAFGGGTGLSNLLRGLRHYTSNITAVVAVSDDGGSSGRLREEFGIPAPGDLTDCLAALSDNELHVSQLLEHRYARGNDLAGHTFGNLLITTLTEVEGDFARAVRVLNSLLNICGAVYPVTTEPTALRVRKKSGEEVYGESNVREIPGAVEEVWLEPQAPALVPDVGLAIAAADVIVLGPGSLFTSTLPPILVPASKNAVRRASASIVYICNLMTEAGETDGFSAWDHVAALYDHLGRYPDVVLVNTGKVDQVRLERYRAAGSDLVRYDAAPFEAAGITVIPMDFISGGKQAAHDSHRLAQWLNDYCKSLRSRALSA